MQTNEHPLELYFIGEKGKNGILADEKAYSTMKEARKNAFKCTLNYETPTFVLRAYGHRIGRKAVVTHHEPIGLVAYAPVSKPYTYKIVWRPGHYKNGSIEGGPDSILYKDGTLGRKVKSYW